MKSAFPVDLIEHPQGLVSVMSKLTCNPVGVIAPIGGRFKTADGAKEPSNFFRVVDPMGTQGESIADKRGPDSAFSWIHVEFLAGVSLHPTAKVRICRMKIELGLLFPALASRPERP